VAEQLQDSTYLGFQICVHEMSDTDIDLMIEAFCKVWSHLDELR
jgi:perosamine synthetase